MISLTAVKIITYLFERDQVEQMEQIHSRYLPRWDSDPLDNAK